MKRFAFLLLAAGLALSAQAQDSKVSKEREALRRAQNALRAAQEQQSTLQADKARAEAEAAAARKDASGAKAQSAGVATRLKAREAELEALRGQLQAAQQAREQAREAAEARIAEREQAMLQQLATARQESAARQQANQALVQLLERNNKALADAEARNHDLYDIGRELVARWQGRSALDKALLHDPVLGLTAVRFEDQAEKLRAELEARRMPGPTVPAMR